MTYQRPNPKWRTTFHSAMPLSYIASHYPDVRKCYSGISHPRPGLTPGTALRAVGSGMKKKAGPPITSFFTKRSDPKNIQESNNSTTSTTTPSTPTNDNASELPTPSFEATGQQQVNHHVNQTANSVNNTLGSLVNGPCQPKLKCYPKRKQNRCFQACWYSSFPWLEYSTKEHFALLAEISARPPQKVMLHLQKLALILGQKH